MSRRFHEKLSAVVFLDGDIQPRLQTANGSFTPALEDQQGCQRPSVKSPRLVSALIRDGRPLNVGCSWGHFVTVYCYAVDKGIAALIHRVGCLQRC